MFKSGFITVIGEPNVGKSTFLNQVLHHKVAIVSMRPQTTRDVIQGIYNDETSQMVFIDTPGIHDPITKLGEYMSEAALRTVKTVDVVLYMINAYEDFSESNRKILESLSGVRIPVFLIINKLDAIKDFRRLRENVEKYKAVFSFAGAFAISALTGENVPLLLEDIKKLLPEGPKYYPDGELTDRPETFLIRELIREKILELTRDEIPHSVMVTIDQMKKNAARTTLKIYATIIVERPNQKQIIIGANGSMLKEIGTKARLDIEEFLGEKVYLELFVKVEEDWRNREFYLKNYGYKPDRE
ncbi:MAG TPA: GTPase Era [Candidatus Izemoplasmatales bacterium]|nr:GTPase Era [Candidatus Izemoplasmatales bacterium]